MKGREKEGGLEIGEEGGGVLSEKRDLTRWKGGDGKEKEVGLVGSEEELR